MQDADFLHTAFKGQQDAVDLVMALVRVSQCWDDLVDRDKPVGAGAINAAFYDALVAYRATRFTASTWIFCCLWGLWRA